MKRRIIGLTIVSVTLVSIAVWEFWGRENIAYQSVLVLAEDTGANAVISEEMLEVKRLEAPSEDALRPEDAEKIMGMETSQFVAKNTELRKEYFRISAFATGGDTKRAVMSLPSEWLLSLPQSLRRGDRITVYNKKMMILEAVVAHVRDSGNREVISEDSERLNGSGVISHVEIIGGVDELVELARLGREGNRFTLIFAE